MSSQLEQLLGYLERDGVTEVLFGSGRPIAMRKGGALTNITARPLSADQLATMLRGSDITALIPAADGEGPTGDITAGRRRAMAQVARRGHEIVVSLRRIDGVPVAVAPGTQPIARVALPPTASTALTPPRAKTPTSARAKGATSAPRSKGASSAPRSKSPTRAKSGSAEQRAKSSTAVRASGPAPRTKAPTSAPRKKAATAIPKARTTTSSHGSGPLRAPAVAAPPAPPPPPATNFDFSLDDNIELGAPVVATPAHDDGAISLGALDTGTFELDLGPPLGGAGEMPPGPPDGFDVDFSTSPPHRFGGAAASANARDDGFVKVDRGGGFAKPTSGDGGFAKPDRGGDFARPTSGDAGFAKVDRGGLAKPEPLDRFAPPGRQSFERASTAVELADEPPQEIAHAGTQPIQMVRPPAAAHAATLPGLEHAATGQYSAIDDAPPAMSRTIARVEHPAFAALVEAAREAGASDLHIAAARLTSFRIHGELLPVEPNGNPLSAQAAEELLLPLLDPAQQKQLATVGYVDLALEAPGGGRLRANISRQQQGLKGTFRLALAAPATLEQLGLPADLAKVVAHHQGLIVIAGPSGHGKTTTLAALVDLLNSSKPYHILTIEDPVEIVHPRKQAVVSQRETGRHTQSFARGLKASLREDPDVIVIGELRDRESVEIALTAAETGHLVIATMSTPSAPKTIDRLIDMFPPEEHSQVRASIAGALRAIIAQRLLPKRGGGIVPAIELVTGVLPLAVLIRDDKLFQLPSLMQRGRAFGMIRFDESLAEHVRAGRIDEETALAVADSKKDLAAALRPPAAPAPQPKTSQLWGFGKKGSDR